MRSGRRLGRRRGRQRSQGGANGDAGPSHEAATIAVVCRARATGRENPEPVQLIQRLIPAKHTRGATQGATQDEPPISMTS